MLPSKKKDVGYWIKRATAYALDGKPEDALKATMEAIKLQPNDPELWGPKGAIEKELRRYDDALKSLEKSLELDPSSANSWLFKARVLFELDRYDDALQAIDECIRLNPANVLALLDRGLIFLGLKRTSEAIASMEKARKLDPKYATEWLKGVANLAYGTKKASETASRRQRRLALKNY